MTVDASPLASIPYDLYTDPALYARERERIFRGHAWTRVPQVLPAGDGPMMAAPSRAGARCSPAPRSIALHRFRFAEKTCAYDGNLILSTLIYPL